MNKLKLFLENFLIYGIGGIISKIIPLIMVPLVTRLMPNSDYYGISDLSNTVISFGSALAVMGMYDAMYRMFFEKEDDYFRKRVCSTAMVFTLMTSVIIFLLMLICKDVIAQYFLGNRKYAYVVYLSAIATLVGATNSIVSAPIRMRNKRKVFLIINTASPVLSYAISVPMLLAGYYVIALPLAAVISGATMELVFWILNKEWFSFKLFDKRLLKPLLAIAIPLLPNFLIYWIFNSCDKVMLTNMIGVGAAGIYSVGSKLGHCSQLIYTAFAGGWQYFAFSTMKEDNQVKSNSLIFEYLGIISFTATAFICAWSYFIYRILFTEEYIRGYIVAPYLFLAPLLQMLFQVACNQLLVVKKTWPNIPILSLGAVVNIIINFVLIPLIGIEGAAIATLSGYIISDIVCVIVLCKMKLMVLNKKFLVSAAIMALYFIVWRNQLSMNPLGGTIMAVIVSGILVFLYKKDIKKLMNSYKRTDTEIKKI